MHMTIRTFIGLLGLIPLLAFGQNTQNNSDKVTREWKDADGKTVPCQIFLPVHYDNAKKYPLVLL